jgi:hypothetical protein
VVGREAECQVLRVIPASAQAQEQTTTADAVGGDRHLRQKRRAANTGASLFGTVLADAGPGGPADSVESFAAVLAGNTPNAAAGGLGALPDLPALAAAVTKAKGACRSPGAVAVASRITGAAGASHRWLPRLSGRYGVIAMETGVRPTLIALPASSVAVQIGVTVFEPLLTT